MSEAADGVRVRIDGRAGRITLDRPAALNALTHDMVTAIDRALRHWADDDRVALVVIEGAGGKAFCAGGDIQALYRHGRAGELDAARRFWADEYRLDARIHRYAKPVVAMMDGIVMGGGVGLSAHASHRVVTERSVVAMPECSIGLVPDVGASLILATAPGHLGEYLAMTGDRMQAGDAIATGFADVYVPAEHVDVLVERLIETGDAAAVPAFAQAPPAAPLSGIRGQIDRAFGVEDARAIVDRLEAAASEWAAETLQAVRRCSPLSLAATVRIIRTVRDDPSIDTALRHEYRFTWRSLDQGEFLEGIRAAIIDKDRAPRWRPATLRELDDARLDAVTAPLGAHELEL